MLLRVVLASVVNNDRIAIVAIAEAAMRSFPVRRPP